MDSLFVTKLSKLVQISTVNGHCAGAGACQLGRKILDLRPHFAIEDMVVIRNRSSERKEEKVVPEAAPLERGWQQTDRRYRRRSIYLLTDKGERRATGSYYTPNHIVDYIVDKTLGPLCEQIDQNLGIEIEGTQAEHLRARGERRDGLQRTLETLVADFDDRVLRLRVVDPAMGSGHFLIRACQYLAEQIATNPHTGDSATTALHGDEPTLVYWKRRVAESCLYGVDRNPMAVELAKLALWLETVAMNQPLTFLDHHLRQGDSLIGATVTDMGGLPGAPLMANLFEQRVKSRLPALLRTAALIRKMPSDTLEQVKQKDRLFRKTFEPVREPFRQAAHVWTATYFLKREQQVSAEQYTSLLEALDKPNKVKSLLEQEPYKKAVVACSADGAAAFHWELEFPEVFFGDAGQRSDAGFDAVIGNPPYDVLSELEIGKDLSRFNDFIKHTTIYEPSMLGKNNLYKLFACRGLNLLTENGRLGFITPMAILGDKITRAIRREILRRGAFTAIEAFPQKDDPDRRVFREAKLSTAVFVVKKAASTTDREKSFVSRVHPANAIEVASPTLLLSAKEIPQYDPTNYTITSCDQADWDLAVKITNSGRISRLGQFVSFFQGEVNETNERKKGNLLSPESGGKLVTRGASVCLYAIRSTSQGEDLYLNVSRFLSHKKRKSAAGKGGDRKADHYKWERVVLQESSPQNNFRRIIAACVGKGEFCNHTINYAPEHRSRVPLPFLLALLNSKLADWYFRLGSTNAHVSQYQLQNLPCPEFTSAPSQVDSELQEASLEALRSNRFLEVPDILAPGLAQAPFPPAVCQTIMEAVQKIIAIETARGEIARADRSALAPTAQKYQDLIDRLLYRMAGISDAEAEALEARLQQML